MGSNCYYFILQGLSTNTNHYTVFMNVHPNTKPNMSWFCIITYYFGSIRGCFSFRSLFSKNFWRILTHCYSPNSLVEFDTEEVCSLQISSIFLPTSFCKHWKHLIGLETSFGSLYSIASLRPVRTLGHDGEKNNPENICIVYCEAWQYFIKWLRFIVLQCG